MLLGLRETVVFLQLFHSFLFKHFHETMNPVEQYKALRPTLEAFSLRLKNLLLDIAHDNDIDVHVIEARTKTVDSFSEKLSRPGKSYQNPLEEITDLCGLRVILYYQEDVDKFCNLIREELYVDDSKSVDKRHELRADQFGYVSIHLISRLNTTRMSLVEWRKYHNLNVEIQVRTVLQHAWASISHALQYKSKADIPNQFVRQLTRIAGLLELSDEQFSNLRAQRESLRTTISASLRKNDLDVQINALALEQYLESSTVVTEIVDAARAKEFQLYDGVSGGQLIEVCQILGIGELIALNELLVAFTKNSHEFFLQLKVKLSEEGRLPNNVSGGLDHWCAVAIVAMNHDATSIPLIVEQGLWGEDYLMQVRTAAKYAGI